MQPAYDSVSSIHVRIGTSQSARAGAEPFPFFSSSGNSCSEWTSLSRKISGEPIMPFVPSRCTPDLPNIERRKGCVVQSSWFLFFSFPFRRIRSSTKPGGNHKANPRTRGVLYPLLIVEGHGLWVCHALLAIASGTAAEPLHNLIAGEHAMCRVAVPAMPQLRPSTQPKRLRRAIPGNRQAAKDQRGLGTRYKCAYPCPTRPGKGVRDVVPGQLLDEVGIPTAGPVFCPQTAGGSVRGLTEVRGGKRHWRASS